MAETTTSAPAATTPAATENKSGFIISKQAQQAIFLAVGILAAAWVVHKFILPKA